MDLGAGERSQYQPGEERGGDDAEPRRGAGLMFRHAHQTRSPRRRSTARRASVAIAASALVALACGGLARPASAQVSSDDLRCIATFNKSIRKVVKAHARLVHKCLSNFAAGRLASATPEACIASDPGGKVAATIAKETDKINRKCPSGLPGFGVSTVSTALTRAVLAQFDLVHAYDRPRPRHQPDSQQGRRLLPGEGGRRAPQVRGHAPARIPEVPEEGTEGRSDHRRREPRGGVSGNRKRPAAR